jgi:hypothetical protein
MQQLHSWDTSIRRARRCRCCVTAHRGPRCRRRSCLCRRGRSDAAGARRGRHAHRRARRVHLRGQLAARRAHREHLALFNSALARRRRPPQHVHAHERRLARARHDLDGACDREAARRGGGMHAVAPRLALHALCERRGRGGGREGSTLVVGVWWGGCTSRRRAGAAGGWGARGLYGGARGSGTPHGRCRPSLQRLLLLCRLSIPNPIAC